MIIQLEKSIKASDSEIIRNTLAKYKFAATLVNTQFENYLVCIGKNELDIREIGHLSGVKDVHRVSDNYKLVSNKWKTKNTEINLGDGVVICDGSAITGKWLLSFST